jgi:hypothetical protein
MGLPTIFKMVQLAADHIPAARRNSLLLCARHRDGLWHYLSYTLWSVDSLVFVVSNEQAAVARSHGLPDLARCIEYAEQLGCDYLMLDEGGARIEGMPVFRD